MTEEIKNQQQREELSDQDLNQVTGGDAVPPKPPPPPPSKSTTPGGGHSIDHKDW